MMRRLVVTIAALAVCSVPVYAQNANEASQCTGEGQAQDACQKATDLFNYMAPQLGTMIAGGNATLGQGGTLGGLGKFSIGVRANALMGQLPQLGNVSISTANAPPPRSDIPMKSQVLPMPVVDAAIGIFKGLPLGVTNVGGIDLLVSASYIPAYNNSSVDVAVPNGSLKFGYGARLGILQEGIITPGISVSYLKRDLPTVSISGFVNNGADTLVVHNLDVSTTAWRVVASKSLLVIGLAAGYGQDKYSSAADLQLRVHEGGFNTGSGGVTPASFKSDMTRSNMFLDASLNLILVRLTAEIGQVSGGSDPMYNNASKAADGSRLYASAGLGIKF